MKGRKSIYWTNLVWLLLLGVSLPGLTAAQTVIPVDTTTPATSRLGFGAQVGYFGSAGSDKGAFYYGAAARYRIGSMLGFEATLGYRGEQLFNFGRVSGNDLSANITSVPLTASVMVFIPLRSTSFVPYGMLGFGLYLMSVDYSADINKVMGDETETKFGTHLGVGINMPLTEKVIAHADYRYLFLKQIFEGGPIFDFSSVDYSGSSLTLGFMVFF